MPLNDLVLIVISQKSEALCSLDLSAKSGGLYIVIDILMHRAMVLYMLVYMVVYYAATYLLLSF